MTYLIQKCLAYITLKLANAFASRSVRRKVKTWYFSKYSILGGVADEFRKKYEALAQKRDSVETLALGSSHGYHGFLPDEKSFNLCGTSQDLYLSCELYKRYADLPKLKHVILFYSVFSPGFETERTSEMEYCLYYKYFWGIPLRYNTDDYFKYKWRMLGRYLRKHPMDAIGDYRGENEYKFFMSPTMSVEERVASHLKNNRRGNSQTEYVREMAELAEYREHKLVVVIPPFRSDFAALLPPFDEMFAELLALQAGKPSIQILSFMGDKDFDDSDFGDTDHLNRQGAEKLTAKLMGSLEML